MNANSGEKLTSPDLVLLSLLAEQPMHGYQANATLVFRKVREWVGVSRPQVYYSLEKLARLGLLESSDGEQAGGPERRVFSTTVRGREALAEALEREDWTEHAERPPFLTWLALSWQCRPGAFSKQLRRRREFLEHQLRRKQRTLQEVMREVGHPFHEAVWMLSLTIEQLRTELTWLEGVEREAPKRAPARHPAPPPG